MTEEEIILEQSMEVPTVTVKVNKHHLPSLDELGRKKRCGKFTQLEMLNPTSWKKQTYYLNFEDKNIGL